MKEGRKGRKSEFSMVGDDHVLNPAVSEGDTTPGFRNPWPLGIPCSHGRGVGCGACQR